jgi:threonine dehydrogenase-like Zn-dependent dehydrogenase
MRHFLRLADTGRLNLDGVVTHRFALDDWRAAFRTLADQHETGAVKVVFADQGR